jgi:hypothetical protein
LPSATSRRYSTATGFAAGNSSAGVRSAVVGDAEEEPGAAFPEDAGGAADPPEHPAAIKAKAAIAATLAPLLIVRRSS